MFRLADRRTLVLASASLRRAELLASVGLPFVIRPSSNSEPAASENEDPAAYVRRVAQGKSAAPASDPEIILSADTIVSVDNRILGKPSGPEEAFSMLRLLNGRQHEVYSGFCLRWHMGKSLRTVSKSSCTRVHFASWPDAVLTNYANCGEPLDKAGAYAIQGVGGFLVQSIQGSWCNVVGLPLTMLLETMWEAKLLEAV